MRQGAGGLTPAKPDKPKGSENSRRQAIGIQVPFAYAVGTQFVRSASKSVQPLLTVKKFFSANTVIFLAGPRSARRARAVLRSPSGNSDKGALPL